MIPSNQQYTQRGKRCYAKSICETFFIRRLTGFGGDILTAVDREPVISIEGLRTFLETNYQVGDTVQVTLMRNGQGLTLSAKLTEESTQ